MSIGLLNQEQQADHHLGLNVQITTHTIQQQADHHLGLNVQITTHTIQFFTLVQPMFCGLTASMSEAFLAYPFIDFSIFSFAAILIEQSAIDIVVGSLV